MNARRRSIFARVTAALLAALVLVSPAYATSVKIAYGSSSNLTITLASLATSSTLLVGRESTEVDNSSNLYSDYLLSGKITTGTSPTASKSIEVWVVAQLDDSTYPDVFDGTDSAETITSDGVKYGIVKLAAIITTSSTSDVSYYFGPVSVAAMYGGSLPRKFVVFVTHNTGQNLNATGGNQQITVKGVYYTIAALDYQEEWWAKPEEMAA